MKVVNGHKFAECEKEFMDSLFDKSGSCAGYAKTLKREVRFYDLQKTLFAFINADKVAGKARKIDNGKNWYTYADPYFIENIESYAEKCQAIADFCEKYSKGRDAKGYFFK